MRVTFKQEKILNIKMLKYFGANDRGSICKYHV